MGYLLKLGMACGLWLVVQTAMSEEPPASVDYLLLKNGSVLTGRVVQEGQTYIVRNLKSTGESRYPASMVAKLCTSAKEVYDILKKNSVEDDADDHCRLARFCLSSQLLKEARQEITEALKVDRRSTEAQQLLRQWTALQKTDSKPSTTEVPSLPGDAVLPLPAASLEDWPIAMNPAVFQDFRLRVQPMLNMGCGTGACHGVVEGKRAFVLKKGLAGVPPSQMMTQTNLERVLALVNQANPDASELLKRAQQPHAHIKTWPVSLEQQNALRMWVNMMAGKADVVRQEPGNSDSAAGKKGNNAFASGGDRQETVPPPAAVQGTARESVSGKLPVIPGMSGAAIQQTSGERPVEQPTTPPVNKGGGSTGSGSGLPPIPGLSGKGQNGENKTPPGPPRTQLEQSTEQPPRQSVNFKDNLAFLDYAKRLGLAPLLPEQKDAIPDRMQITNAGTYRVERALLPQFSDDVIEQLKKQEQGKKADSKDTENGSMILRSGTIVNSPPR